jgi:hypothetical protein
MDKDFILQEIIRTAKENKGTPLGQAKFAKETGIGKQDWQGKYWVRWGDAVTEAGYSPNKMVTAYDEDWLINKIIFFIRETGKFPTSGDFRLKAYTTQGFPHDGTIYNHFKSQSVLANSIINYCENMDEFVDVKDICIKYLNSSRQNIANSSKISEDNADYGYVYLMKSGRFYKIGKSKNVEMRNYNLGLILPEEINILHKIKTDDPDGIENYWHNRFKEKRKGQSEWFALSTSDIADFKRRKFM